MTKRNLLGLTFAAIAGVTLVIAATTEETEVLRVEDSFRQAKLKNDVKTLSQILADDYSGMNQWGARRGKSSLLELFQSFRIDSLTTLESTVRITGGTAIVDGVMTETGPGGDFKNMLFSRVYVKRDGRWQLWSSFQMMPMSQP